MNLNRPPSLTKELIQLNKRIGALERRTTINATPGGSGTSGVDDKNYVHDQGVASATWTINHGLNKYPSVEVVDSSNRVVRGKIVYTDSTQVVITFNSAFAGKAYLN